MDEAKNETKEKENETKEKEQDKNEHPSGEYDELDEQMNDGEDQQTETKEEQPIDQSVSENGTESENEEEDDDLADQLERVEKELEETKDRLLRVQAEYENFRKRTRKERESEAKYRSQRLVEELLPVVDNFERALAVEAKEEQAKSILKGVEMVYNQFIDALSKEGVEEIKALGEPFDPHKHQAVMQEKSDEHESGIVLEVLQKGYQLKDKVIRPAMVKVNE